MKNLTLIITLICTLCFAKGQTKVFKYHATNETQDLYDSGRLDINNGTVGTAYGIQISNNVARLGNYSCRYEVNATDPKPPAAPSSVRAERKEYMDTTNYYKFYSLSIYCDTGCYDSKNFLVKQWYSNAYSNTFAYDAPLQLWIWNGKFRLVQKFDSSEVQVLYAKYWDLGQIKWHDWTDFAFEINWSYGPDGYIKVYRDGQQINVTQQNNGGTSLGVFQQINGANFNKELGKKQKPTVDREGIYAFGGFGGNSDKRVIYIDESYKGGRSGDNLTINDFLLSQAVVPKPQPASTVILPFYIGN